MTGETITIIFGIILAAVLVLVWPTMTMADRVDDAAKVTVQAQVSDTVDTVRTTGRITREDYDELIQTITSTGNTYDVNITVQEKDINVGKKVSQAQADKIGENQYVTKYNSQVVDAIERDGEYLMKEGDIVSISVKNSSQTMAQQMKNFFYTVTGNDAATIVGEHAGIVTKNGHERVNR